MPTVRDRVLPRNFAGEQEHNREASKAALVRLKFTVQLTSIFGPVRELKQGDKFPMVIDLFMENGVMLETLTKFVKVGERQEDG